MFGRPGTAPWRWVARGLLACLLAQLLAPAVLAGDDDVFFQGELDPGQREAYIARYYSDQALWEELHRQQQAAQQRQAPYDQHLQYWQEMRRYPPPPDWDQGESNWRRHVDQKVQQFQDWSSKNAEQARRAAQRYQEQIERMRKHERTVTQSRDEIVRQNLGTVIGVAGMSRWVAPIQPTVNPSTGALLNPGRITGGEITGAAAQGGRIATRAVIGNTPARLQQAGSAATKWGGEAGARADALPTQGRSLLRGLFGFRSTPGAPAGATSMRTWEAVPTGPSNGAGQYVLRQVDVAVGANGAAGARTPVPGAREIPTGIAVRQPQGNTWVESTASQQLAQARAMNQQGMTQARQGIESVRLRAQEQAGTQTGKILNRTGQTLDAKAQRLEAATEQYRADHQGQMAARAKYLAGSAAKWAVFSAGIAVTSRAVESYRQTGSIDWGYATQDLTNVKFWTGTGGAFLGSMAASALVSGITAGIPGGAFIRTFAAIGGAAVGFQAGSGNLATTDWTQLGVTTLGSTIGAIMGSAFGPIGTILGGMAGHFIADWALSKLRDFNAVPSEAYSSRADYQQAGGGGGGYVGGAPGERPGAYGGVDAYGGSSVGSGPGGSSGGGGGDVVQIQREIDRARAEFLSAQQRGDPGAVREWFERIKELETQKRAARAGFRR